MLRLYRRALLAVFASCLPLLVLASLHAQTAVKVLGEGVVLTQHVQTFDGGPQIVNVLEIDLLSPAVRAKSGLAEGVVYRQSPTQGRETVSATVQRLGALAGVNADFFPFTGDPLGTHVQDGELVSEPSSRTAFGLTAQREVIFGEVVMRAEVLPEGGEPLPLNGINRLMGANECVLITPRWGEVYPLPDGAVVLTLRVEGYTCREIAEQLAIAVGTVKSYLAELRQKFRDFYGYDPTKRPSQGGYINGNASEVSTPHGKEDISNASTHRSGHDGGSASGGKRVCPAAHPRRARRRAGGGVDPASLMLGEGCGCSDSPLFVLPGLAIAPIAHIPAGSKEALPGANGLLPLIATCINVEEDCKSFVERQRKCVNEWWRPTCFGQFEEYERFQYIWKCGNCYVVRCCGWYQIGCCTRLVEPPCQGDYPPCARPVCSEPQPNCQQ